MSITHKSIALSAVFICANALFSSQILAQTAFNAKTDIKIDGAWIRTAVQGQSGTGGFMTLTAKENTKLISVASPVAGVGEVHEMKMDGNVMRMREVAGGLELPAGKAVELKPGGYHVMLMQLKNALPVDSKVPLTLTFANAKGEKSSVELQVPVAVRAPGSAPGSMPADMKQDGHKNHDSKHKH
jgi:periplasmic copper chaperone A